jgi:hypothetical protein
MKVTGQLHAPVTLTELFIFIKVAFFHYINEFVPQVEFYFGYFSKLRSRNLISHQYVAAMFLTITSIVTISI